MPSSQMRRIHRRRSFLGCASSSASLEAWNGYAITPRLVQSERHIHQLLIALNLQGDRGARRQGFQGVSQTVESGHWFADQDANDVASGERYIRRGPGCSRSYYDAE